MKHFNSIREAYTVCDALGSPARLEIMEQILSHGVINLDTLAKNLHLTNGALTKHIKKLEESGLIRVELAPGKRGHTKHCSVNIDKILIDISSGSEDDPSLGAEIPLGLYCDYKVSGLCGLASHKGYIGKRDEISSFISSTRAEASLLWLESGFVTYLLPVYKNSNIVEEYQIVFEISSDLIGGNFKTESTVSFFLNNISLGKATICAPSFLRRGFYTPAWFAQPLPQYGIQKTLRITKHGTYLDGEKLKGQLFDLSRIPEKFTIATDDGFILFGRGFGDYNSGIRFNMVYL